jgi:predicted ATPase
MRAQALVARNLRRTGVRHDLSQEARRLRYFCSPQHADSALYPIINQMERAAGFAYNDTAQAKLDKLDALLAQSFTPGQDTALIADMLFDPKRTEECNSYCAELPPPAAQPVFNLYLNCPAFITQVAPHFFATPRAVRPMPARASPLLARTARSRRRTKAARNDAFPS